MRLLLRLLPPCGSQAAGPASQAPNPYSCAPAARPTVSWLTFLPFCAYRELGWVTVPVDVILVSRLARGIGRQRQDRAQGSMTQPEAAGRPLLMCGNGLLVR
jgi:hypothetical protein